MLGEFRGLLVGFILGGSEGLVGVGIGASEDLFGVSISIGNRLIGLSFGGGEGLVVGGFHFVAFLGSLTDGDLLFFQGLLDGGELLGCIGLSGVDAVISQLGQLFVATGEGLEHVLRILLSGGEGGLLGVELGFQFGHAFGGGLTAGGVAAGGGEFSLGLGDLGVRRGEGGGDFVFGGSDLLGEVIGIGSLDLSFEVSAALFEFGEGGRGRSGSAGIAFSEGGPEVRFGFGDLGFGSSVRTLCGGRASFIEGLADGVELGLGSSFALGEGGLHLLGGVDDGGDIGLEGARSFDGFAIGLLHEALEFGFVAFRNGDFAGGGQLGQRDVDLGGEAEVEGTPVVGTECWL